MGLQVKPSAFTLFFDALLNWPDSGPVFFLEMKMVNDIDALLERVRAATGPDREIDGRLWCLITPNRSFIGMAKNGQVWGDFEPGGFNPKSGVTAGMVFERTDYKGTREDIQHNGGRVQSFPSSPAYTASIDAALALTERVLPGWVVADLCQNSRHAGDPWGCTLAVYFGSTPSKNKSASSGYDFPTAPLAILAATLTALIQQEGTTP